MSLIEIQSKRNFHLPQKVFIVVIPSLKLSILVVQVLETFQHE